MWVSRFAWLYEDCASRHHVEPFLISILLILLQQKKFLEVFAASALLLHLLNPIVYSLFTALAAFDSVQ